MTACLGTYDCVAECPACRQLSEHPLAYVESRPAQFGGQADSTFYQRTLFSGIYVAHKLTMLKLLGSYALAKLLGFGLFGAIVIYALLSLLT